MEFVYDGDYPLLIFDLRHVVVVRGVVNIVFAPDLIAVLCPALLYAFFVVWGRGDDSMD